MKIVNVAEMVAMEKATDAAGFSYDQMMAEAGAALADTVLAEAPARSLVLFLIGPGNNGGDGLVACARLQEAGVKAIPYIWKRKSAQDPLVAAVSDVEWAENDPDHERLRALLAECGVLVDALLGTGNTRALSGSLAELLGVVHQVLAERRRWQPRRFDPTRPSSRPELLVVACDCPSGLFCDTGQLDPLALPADITVTFALPKRGHFLQPGASACGRLVIADINIDRGLAPEDAPDLLTPYEIASLLPERPPAAHKGTFGRALIVAGSANFPGAAIIASIAAYRVGAGLVHLAAPALVGEIAASVAPEPVHTILPSDMGALTEEALPLLESLLPGHKALLVGPGIGRDPRTVELVEALLTGK
ncbi:MAG: bifunctional ADP-dependent NAD(P)H-hydrate dehydratase/NAD(P)H-hydrate epimerase, partial [Caldilineae bacterium]